MKLITSGIITIAVLLTSNITNSVTAQMHRGGMMGGGMMDSGMMGMMKAGAQSDRHFIEMMIPHHVGAVKMADILLKRTKKPELRQLATAIKQAQTREINEMKTWYKQWYQTDVPAIGRSRGMGMGGGGMQRMMDTQIQELEKATDSDRVFLEEMIPHHKMALMMTAHIVDSDRGEMRTLAKNIIQSQSAEIEKMRQWYKAWYR